jgi:hypothetical protein
MNATAWIKFKGNTKVEDTKPELKWDEFAKENYISSFKPHSFWVYDEEGKGFEFRPDRGILGGSLIVYIEIDGPYHRTPRQVQKTKWRDELITHKADCRVLHIDSELLLKEKYWLKLYQDLQKFLMLGKMVEHIYA